jgi:hopanoid-associated phosphorylase
VIAVHPRGLVIAATGLKAEARIAERSEGVVAVAGGGDEARLAGLIEHAIDEGVRGIISFGIAGALQPGLMPGTLVVGASVVSEGQSYPANDRWANRLCASLPDAVRGAVAGTSKAIADVKVKAATYDATGAVAVDMESHVVVRIARKRSLPFAVLRVIADTAGQRLPPAAVGGLKPDGSPDIAAVLRSLASEPSQLPDLIRTALATRQAMNGLLRCHRLVGPGLGFGFVDFG